MGNLCEKTMSEQHKERTTRDKKTQDKLDIISKQIDEIFNGTFKVPEHCDCQKEHNHKTLSNN